MNKAVLVGINQYANQPYLAGCVNDVADVRRALLEHATVEGDQIVVLTDRASTKANIVRALGEMIAALVPGDLGYFHYSGYGAHAPFSDPQGPDGLDEVLCPYEFDWSAATTITAKEMLLQLGALELGARLVVSFDCGHSGNAARAPTRYGQPRSLVPPPSLYTPSPVVRTSFRAAGRAVNVSFVSACSSSQIAADTSFYGRPNGAFTYYFLKELNAAPAKQSLSATTDAIEPQLHPYAMTPAAENGEGTYFRAVGDKCRAATPVRGPRNARSASSASPARAA